MATNPDHFCQQLPFYQIRPLYLSLVYLLLKIGVPIVTSTVLISVVSAVLTALIVLLWISKHISRIYAALISFFLVIASGLFNVARLSTPDTLSSAIIFFSFFLLIEKRSLNIACSLMVLSLFARTDNVILAVIFITYLKIVNPYGYGLGFRRFLFFLILMLLIYLGINFLACSHGWWGVFSHTFFGPFNNPAEYRPDFSLWRYGFVLMKGIRDLNGEPASFFLLLAVLSLIGSKVKAGFGSFIPHITLIPLIGLFAHFLLFPVWWPRFFLAHFLIIGIGFIITLSKSGFPLLIRK
ncbi:hypothetical protein ACFLQR_04705 [Verrucomicrobiota bacterium]